MEQGAAVGPLVLFIGTPRRTYEDARALGRTSPAGAGASPVQAILTSINDAARALNLGRTSIYALIREGRLETVKMGRRTLVKVDSIHRLVGDVA